MRYLIVLCHSSSEVREVVGARFTAPAIHRRPSPHDPGGVLAINRGRGEPGPYHTAHDGVSCEQGQQKGAVTFTRRPSHSLAGVNGTPYPSIIMV